MFTWRTGIHHHLEQVNQWAKQAIFTSKLLNCERVFYVCWCILESSFHIKRSWLFKTKEHVFQMNPCQWLPFFLHPQPCSNFAGWKFSERWGTLVCFARAIRVYRICSYAASIALGWLNIRLYWTSLIIECCFRMTKRASEDALVISMRCLIYIKTSCKRCTSFVEVPSFIQGPCIFRL